MFTKIEALGFRSLRYVCQPLGPFHVLVGPNASGKTTFLDVIAFLGQLVSEGLEAAVGDRTANFQDLVWGRSGDRFELAVEAMIPEERRKELGEDEVSVIRYEVSVGTEPQTGEVSLLRERVILKVPGDDSCPPRNGLFPVRPDPPSTLLSPTDPGGTRTVVTKLADGRDVFQSELRGQSGMRWPPTTFKLGPRKSALGNLPEDESKFPVATWLKQLLWTGVQQLILNSALIRKASPPGQVRGFKPDGSNLPWVVEGLRQSSPDRFADWIAHLQTALPDLEDIRTVERADDRHRYLMLRYHGGLEVPSWMVSDGTLRLLALTLPAYLPDFTGVYLIEEPENGIHPRAVETMFQSLSSVYSAQILMATHSPVILGLVERDDVLCFAKKDGATDIVVGSKHPALLQWDHETNLSTLFAAGVLG